MRETYINCILLMAGAVFFAVVIQILAAVRLARDRFRELYFAGSLITVAVLTMLSYLHYSGKLVGSYWFRLGGACFYFTGPLLVLGLDGHLQQYRRRFSRVTALLLSLALVGSMLDLFTDLPVAWKPVGDLEYLLIGPGPGGRISLAAALAHSVMASLSIVFIYKRVQQAHREGVEELRAYLVVFLLISPFLTYDLLGYAGLIRIFPLGAFLSGLTALALAWHRVERHALLTLAEQRRLELGGYRLGRRIGAGGMAEVFVAERIGPAGFAKQVAIKRILPHLTSDPTFVQMFLDEARLAARLAHPGIAQIHELGCDQGVYFIVMEYVAGVGLDWLRKRAPGQNQRLPPRLVAEIGVQILAALEYAHTLSDEQGRPIGVVHRDVSPQNLLVTEAGLVKVLDFGIARGADRSTPRTVTGAVKGKIQYMPPEQARGASVDCRADLFAMGAVLYELVCGRRPYEGDTEASIMTQLLGAALISPPSRFASDVPAGLEAVIMRALERDPDKRFQTAAAMAEALGVVQKSLGGPAQVPLGAMVTVEIGRAGGPDAQAAPEADAKTEAEADPNAATVAGGRR